MVKIRLPRRIVLFFLLAALTGIISLTGLATSALPQRGPSPALPRCPDQDLDGYAACTGGCNPSAVTCGDCDDADPARHPGAAEVCNHVDDNCDGRPDETFPAMVSSKDVQAPDPIKDSEFGAAIVAMGDLTGDGVPDMAVGSPTYQSAAGSGSISIISGASGALVCRMVDAQASTYRLGSQIAAVGDLDGDGVGDIAANTYSAIDVFSGRTCALVRRCADPTSNLNAARVAALNDVTGDGIPEILVGALSTTTARGASAGRVIVFSGADCSVARRVEDPQGQTNDGLGMGVAGLDDLTGDAVPEFAGESVRGVLIFSGTDGSLVRRVTDPTGSSPTSLRGPMLAVSDFDGDGRRDLATFSYTGLAPSGATPALTVFSSRDGTALRRAFDPKAGASFFGSSLAVSPDLTGDGLPEFVVGDTAGPAVSWVLSSAEGTVVQELDRSGSGAAVAVIGDLGHDGTPEIASGAPGLQNDSGRSVGLVTLFAIESDCDGDGVLPFQGDCNDEDPSVAPGHVEVCDGKDNDCDGAIDEDGDHDGYAVCNDCDDRRADVHPGAVEQCNGRDDNCNGLIDEGQDADRDGVPAPCDCDDANPGIRPGAPETCNHRDDNCDGRADEGFASGQGVAAIPVTSAPPADPSGTSFGATLAGIGDVTGDGIPDLAVAAPSDVTLQGVRAGSVSVFSGADRSVVCTVTDPAGAGQATFGQAIAGLGDVTGDGVPDFAVGAAFNSLTPTAAGSVLIFSGSDCRFVRRCTDALAPANGRLGWRLARMPDVTGDGVAEILAAGLAADTSSSTPVVMFSATDCSVLRRFDGSSPYSLEGFGAAIAAIGDVSGDGVADVAVGAPADFVPDHPQGSVALFSGADGSFIRRLVLPTGSSGVIGRSIVSPGDVDGDGVADVATSDFKAQFGASPPASIASMFVFSGADGSLLRVCPPNATGAGDVLEGPLALAGDISGDGTIDVAMAGSAQVRGFPDPLSMGYVAVLSPRDCSVWRRAILPGGFDRILALADVGDVTGDGMKELAVGVDGAAVVVSNQSDCDGDGVTIFGGDCDDADPARHAGLAEVCDGKDNDCDGMVDEDGDGDGFPVCVDCDDRDPAVSPAATEVCNGRDDDCDGVVDEGFDLDHDGVADCRDNCPATANPDQHDTDGNGVGDACDQERCDGLDNNGNGLVDEGFAGIPEVCNHLDDNCDGRVDEGSPVVWGDRKIVNPPGTTSHLMGAAVAGVGDVTGDRIPDFVAGSPDGAFSFPAGSVTLFSGADLSPVCRMTDPNEGPGDALGFSVAAIGDVTGDGVADIAAGAPYDVTGAPLNGSVLIFSGGDCSLVRKCADPSPPARSDTSVQGMGFALAALGDVNGDGVPDFIAGAPAAIPLSGSGSGVATVFSGADCGVLMRLQNPTATEFGHSLAALPDITLDGVREILVGSPGSGNGQVHLYSGNGLYLGPITIPGGPNSRFGDSVVSLGDVDGDGRPDIAVGASRDDTAAGTDSGSVSILRADGLLIRTCTGIPSSPGSRLGTALAVAGDANQDGAADIIAAAPFQNTAQGIDAGSVLMISSRDCSILTRRDLHAGRADGALRFLFTGLSVAGPGDLNGDHHPDILAGAPWDGAAGPAAGSVQVSLTESDCDGDGVSVFGGDCDDADPAVHPGAVETCDQRDDDCDGAVDEDNDGDGFAACADCDNGNASIHPGAAEICNGRDDDCDGRVDQGPDLDGDGFTAPCDCDDANAAIHPGAAEVCNHRDDNCDGRVDESQNAIWSSVKVPYATAGARYGSFLAGLGDVTGDGVPDLAVGSFVSAFQVLSGANRSIVCQASKFAAALSGGPDMSGDGVPDVLVGSTLSGNQGSVEIRSGASCGVVRTCSATLLDSGFGSAGLVAIGDISGDGVPDIAVGEPRADYVTTPGTPQETDAGRVSIVSGATCSSVFSFYTTDHSLSGRPLRFGAAIAATGDLTGDGLPDLAVGEPGDARGGLSALGAVHLVSAADGFEFRKLVDPAGAALDALGGAVAAGQDLTGDGIPDIVAGATGARSGAGQIVIFSGADGSVARRCFDPSGVAGDFLGSPIVLVGDLNGDHVAEIGAAAIGFDIPAGQNAGEVVVFSGADCSIISRLIDPAGAPFDVLGTALAAPGDLNSDGVPDLVAGAPGDDQGTLADAGSLLFFARQPDCDGDGVTPFAGDCQDADPAVHAGAAEVCDGKDNDCDGLVDEGFDIDHDGISDCLDRCPLDPANDADGDGRCGDVDDCPVVFNPAQGDGDSDGVGNLCDTCLRVSDPSQLDSDGDGEGDSCDCAPSNPAVRRPPEPTLEIRQNGDLILTIGGSGADSFSILRGDTAALVTGDYGACLADRLFDPALPRGPLTYTDAGAPVVGHAFFYLAQGKSLSCGLSYLGFDSLERERINTNNKACK